jgi:hypothetical protein
LSTPPPAAPEHPRRLGRSRAYTPDDLSDRLRHWHAPRVNRWERVCITAGRLGIEYLGPGGVNAATLATGDARWFAPGTRWRVADMPPDARFEIEVHADTRGQAEAPQPLRSDLLEAATRVAINSADALGELIDTLAPGVRRIVTGDFTIAEALPVVRAQPALFWHPLDDAPDGFAAFMVRGAQPVTLLTYLGRDHAVIEAALGGALMGDAACDAWLRYTLERHLQIEEQVIFPAYLAAGGRAAWAKGLELEHGWLRKYLGELDQPLSRRHFLRLLDGHDEKEERVVYPDIRERVGADADRLLTLITCRLRVAALR